MIERQQERRSIMKKWMKAGIAAVLAASALIYGG